MRLSAQLESLPVPILCRLLGSSGRVAGGRQDKLEFRRVTPWKKFPIISFDSAEKPGCKLRFVGGSSSASDNIHLCVP
jgi:hypothetical protein